ncbi:MAG TPA: hypothetical protein VGO11_19560 [Chthoniobacteraceae bacterium]|jgi:hypothetical protein|nr:hypothetical protein [Chthoniobacteraceae bacterium]
MARPEDLTEADRFCLAVCAGVPIEYSCDPEQPGTVILTTAPVHITHFRGGCIVTSADASVRLLYGDTARG